MLDGPFPFPMKYFQSVVATVMPSGLTFLPDNLVARKALDSAGFLGPFPLADIISGSVVDCFSGQVE